MWHHRNIWWTACLFILSGFLLVGTRSTAGDKKKDEKKSTGPLLSKSAELKKDDEKDTKKELKNSPRKVYPITLTGGKAYQIDLRSKDFDAFLRLEDAQGKEVAFNDDLDEATTRDSRIIYKPAKTGDFKIIVTSYD